MVELLGYARVSTTEQDATLQHDALSAAGCWRTWTDTASGVKTDRPSSPRCWLRSGRGTPWWCGGSTGSAGRCLT